MRPEVTYLFSIVRIEILEGMTNLMEDDRFLRGRQNMDFATVLVRSLVSSRRDKMDVDTDSLLAMLALAKNPREEIHYFRYSRSEARSRPSDPLGLDRDRIGMLEGCLDNSQLILSR